MTYLLRREDSRVSDLWAYDPATGQKKLLLRAEGEQELSPRERADRERRRARHRGIGRYSWNPEDGSILLPLSGDLHRLRDGALERLTETEAPELGAAWSPDGRALAYVRNANLHVRAGGEERPLTSEGGGKVRCGLPEFIAQEELGRRCGLWWSPDSQSIAYVRTDSGGVPLFRMHDYLPWRGETVEQEYPRAGDRNVAWRLGVVPAAGGETVWMKVQDEYLARVDWMPGGDLAVQVLNRPQTRLRLYRCDPATGESALLLEERDQDWVSLHRDLFFLEDGRFTWTSERSGFR
ncbi:MAG: DPP IV N-terminal domain-containing protein, partial [Planctomycetota bacterium]